MQPVSIDLVVDEVPLEGVERIAPADRIEVDGLETCDYLVYPVEATLADKPYQRTGLPEALRSMEAASELAGRLLDPAIRGEAGGSHWNPEAHEWE